MNSLRTLYRKVLRDLWRNRGRSLLVVLSVAVGVTGVGMIVATQDMLNRDLQRRYAEMVPAHIEYAVPAGVRLDDLGGLRSLPGVVSVQARALYTTRYRDVTGQWQPIELLAFPDPTEQTINRITLQSGVWPGRRQIAVERASLEEMGFSTGDALVVDIQGRETQFEIAGTVHQQDNFTLRVRGTASAVIDWRTIAGAQGHDRFNIIYLTVDDLAEQQQAATAGEARLERAGYTVARATLKNPNRHIAQDMLDVLYLVMTILGGLVLAVSVFLVTNSVSALVAQEIDQIGVLKAIGARTGTVLSLYGLVVLVYGLLGAAVAIPLAGRLGYALAGVIAHRLNIDLYPFRASPAAWAVMLLVGLLAPLAAAGVPLWRGATLTVRQALAGYGLGGGSGDNRALQLVSRLEHLPRVWSLALRNSLRTPARLALTLLTLALAGAIFVAVLSTRASLGLTVDQLVAGQYTFDALFAFVHEERSSRVISLVESHPDVVRAEAWTFDQATMTVPSGQEVTVTLLAGPENSRLFEPSLERGRWWRPGESNAIVLNQRWADDEGVLLGDRVALHVAGSESEWVVVGFNRDLVEQRTGVYVSATALDRVRKRRDHTYTLMVAYRLHDPASQARITTALESLLAANGVDLFSSETMEQIRDQAAELYNILLLFLYTMSLLLAAVGSLGLTGALSLGVIERRREIGVMRAIGADHRAIVTIFWGEGLLIVLASFVLAVLFSLPLSRLLARAVGLAFIHTPLDFAYATHSIFQWLAIVLAVGGAASILPAINAARLRVQESLTYE